MPHPDDQQTQNEISQLFSEALTSISDVESAQLNFEQFSTPGARDELTILFDLALESIEDPNAQDRYIDDIQTSDKRSVNASDLMKQFERIQKAFELPQLTIKALRSMWTHGAEVEELDLSSGRRGVRKVGSASERAGMSFVRANGSEAFAAFFADLVIFVPLTLIITLLLSFLFGMSLNDLGQMLQSFDFVASIVFLRTLILTSTILGLAYAMVHALFHARTPGMSVLGLRFRRADGATATPGELVIRILAWPLSFVLGGVVAIALGRSAIHDLVSGTFISKPGILEPPTPSAAPNAN